MPEAKVYIVELNGQKWPVVKFPKLLLKPEDISTRTEDYKKAVLPVEKNELSVFTLKRFYGHNSNTA